MSYAKSCTGDVTVVKHHTDGTREELIVTRVFHLALWVKGDSAGIRKVKQDAHTSR